MKVYGWYLQNERDVKSYKAFLFICFFSSVVLCKAQTDKVTQEELEKYYPKRFITTTEIVAGPAFTIGRGDPSLYNESSNGKLGYSLGLGLTHLFNSKLGVRLNLLFEAKGDKIIIYGLYYDSIPPKQTKTLNDVRLNYISSSFAISYSFMSNFGFELGTYLAYLQSWSFYQEAYTNGTLVGRYKTKRDPYLTYSKYDYGLRVAFNYSMLKYLSDRVNIQLAGNIGFANIYYPPKDKVINASICLLFRYKISK